MANSAESCNKTVAVEVASITEDFSYVPSVEMQNLWNKIHDQMRDEFGEAVYRSWLKPLTLQAFYHGTLEVSVPTRFIRDWIQTHYAEGILKMCKAVSSEIQRIEYVVVQTSFFAQSENEEESSHHTSTVKEAKASPDKGPFAELFSKLDPRFTFDSFVVGESNALACAAARRVAESASVPFNPLYIYGGVGLGKTHLMHAIAWEIQRREPEKTVLYLSAEKFMYQFVKALRSQDTMNFKDFFRSVDVLIMDDIQFIAGKESTQEEFFHTFNALIDNNKQIIISADRAPSDISGLDERLRSRLAWGLVADVQPSTYELRLGILMKKRELMEANVPQAVLEFLALKIVSNIRELEGALTRLVAHADVCGKEVTLETAQNVLHDLLRSHDQRITIDEIQRKVTEHFSLKMNDMYSARRSRNVARPRQIAMYLAKQLTQRSLPEIGRKFGGRDHTTVMHAVRKIEELIDHDESVSQDVEIIRRTLKG